MTIDYDKPILNKDGNPLKLFEVAKHHCIRCIKKARALKKIGYEIHGMGNKVSYGVNDYETYTVWKNERQFKNAIRDRINLGVDCITWDNEPDMPSVWIREVINEMGVQDKVKLISDFHDLDSVRRLENIIPKPERLMINASDGMIYVSLPIQKMTNKLHSIEKPNICLYSYCNKDIVDVDWKIERKIAMVYEGGVNAPDNQDQNRIYPYRNLFPIFMQLIKQGNEVHAYVGNSDAFLAGQHTGVVLHQPTEYDKLMEELLQYKWGLLVFNNEKDTEPQVRYTLTNKAQEYLQAGIPSLACWCKESEKWVEKHKIGLVFDNIQDIMNCSVLEEKYNDLVENIKTKREELVMENFIWKLENLYAEVLSVDKKGIPNNIKEFSIFEYGKEETDSMLVY